MNISVIVPLFNEDESLPELYAWIERVMKANNFTYEVIFVNDGSTDRSWDVIRELSEKSENVRGIKFRRTMESHQLFIAVSKRQREMSSSQWMQTFRILQMRYQSFTV